MTAPSPTIRDSEQIARLVADLRDLAEDIERSSDAQNVYAAADLIARLPEMEAALKMHYALYTHAWDTVDGNLVMFGESIDKFEAAHAATHKALGYAPLITLEEDETELAAFSTGDAGEGKDHE